MGLIRRDALPGVPMYDAPLSTAEVRARIDGYYRPYRAELRRLLDECRASYGVAWHVDCHSMKSRGNEMNVDAGASRPDIVVSDRRGTTADPALTSRIVGWFTARGYRAQANDPYQGGDLVRSFGDPGAGRQSVQIELNRALYMDEPSTERHAGFDALRDDLTAFAAAFVAWARAVAAPGRG
jgi:N-formylglutamate deformylase